LKLHLKRYIKTLMLLAMMSSSKIQTEFKLKSYFGQKRVVQHCEQIGKVWHLNLLISEDSKDRFDNKWATLLVRCGQNVIHRHDIVTGEREEKVSVMALGNSLKISTSNLEQWRVVLTDCRNLYQLLDLLDSLGAEVRVGGNLIHSFILNGLLDYRLSTTMKKVPEIGVYNIEKQLQLMRITRDIVREHLE